MIVPREAVRRWLAGEDFVEDQAVEARKNRRCNICARVILKGDTYREIGDVIAAGTLGLEPAALEIWVSFRICAGCESADF